MSNYSEERINNKIEYYRRVVAVAEKGSFSPEVRKSLVKLDLHGYADSAKLIALDTSLSRSRRMDLLNGNYDERSPDEIGLIQEVFKKEPGLLEAVSKLVERAKFENDSIKELDRILENIEDTKGGFNRDAKDAVEEYKKRAKLLDGRSSDHAERLLVLTADLPLSVVAAIAKDEVGVKSDDPEVREFNEKYYMATSIMEKDFGLRKKTEDVFSAVKRANAGNGNGKGKGKDINVAAINANGHTL